MPRPHLNKCCLCLRETHEKRMNVTSKKILYFRQRSIPSKITKIAQLIYPSIPEVSSQHWPCSFHRGKQSFAEQQCFPKLYSRALKTTRRGRLHGKRRGVKAKPVFSCRATKNFKTISKIIRHNSLRKQFGNAGNPPRWSSRST